MKATSGPLPTGGGWVYEVKWDGMRVLAEVGPDGVRAWSSGASTPPSRSPSWRRWPRRWPRSSAMFDGEVVALDGGGRPSFERLQRRMHVSSPTEAAPPGGGGPGRAYVVFDLLPWAATT